VLRTQSPPVSKLPPAAEADKTVTDFLLSLVALIISIRLDDEFAMRLMWAPKSWMSTIYSTEFSDIYQ
jgi:hypothetical protein